MGEAYVHGAVTGSVWERPDSLFVLCKRNEPANTHAAL